MSNFLIDQSLRASILAADAGQSIFVGAPRRPWISRGRCCACLNLGMAGNA